MNKNKMLFVPKEIDKNVCCVLTTCLQQVMKKMEERANIYLPLQTFHLPSFFSFGTLLQHLLQRIARQK